jgi:hypothetical protein
MLNTLPSSAEVKNEWSYTSTLPIRLHCVDRDNVTFHLFPAVSTKSSTLWDVVDRYDVSAEPAFFILVCRIYGNTKLYCHMTEDTYCRYILWIHTVDTYCGYIL